MSSGTLLRRARGLPETAAYLLARLQLRLGDVRKRLRPRSRRGPMPHIRSAEGPRTDIDAYWGSHAVHELEFVNRRESKKHLEWRFREYPLFRELSGLWGDHTGEVVLDFGCGPGNDLTGFALHARPARLIGVDVSARALSLAARRLALHRVDPSRIDLIHVSDAGAGIPLEEGSVDFVNCQGVLHHTSDPERILADLLRVLRPGGRGSVMIYNRGSVWVHLYTAYEQMVLENAFSGLDLDAAFQRSTDGPECPRSVAWTPEQFLAMCERAGFEASFLGGYPSLVELESLRAHREAALADERLGQEHRQFLSQLTFDGRGYPLHRGHYAGIGGMYQLRKPAVV